MSSVEEISEDDLYYKFVRSKDELVPYDKMAYRESLRVDNHTANMLEHEVGSAEREFHKELTKRSLDRLTKWRELNECGS